MSGPYTCIQQSAPDGYFRNEDCRQFRNFVCELNIDAVFAEPPAGKVRFCIVTYINTAIISDIYIHSPNYPDDNYPNNYDQV